MAHFYERDFMKGIVILVKVDEMYNILKSAKPLFIGREMSWNEWSKFCRTFVECPSFNKGQTLSRKRYSCRERSWYCNIDDTEIR